MADPQPGEMILYDDILPPLLDGVYKMTASTDVSFDSAAQPLTPKDSFFNIEGPRFALPATEVAGVFPPRNAHGPFDNSIPHIALLRRTLPWERDLDPQNLITNQGGKAITGVPAVAGKAPWLALLLFEEGEYTLLQNVPLEKVVPADVFSRLGSPQNITCDAIEASSLLVSSILPSKEELQLLAHVRHVNKDDRELSVEGSDGYFAVVMSNRLPSDNAKCRACLVSLEERSDLVSKDPLGPEHRLFVFDELGVDIGHAVVHPVAAPPVAEAAVEHPPAPAGVELSTTVSGVVDNISFLFKTRLVLLHSWQFQTIGTGTFRRLMQELNVGMIGKIADPGHPALTDTFHLKLELQDRAGVPEQAWYRGPLVPFELTRDPLGPYHSADQARRATPETGGEDVSYAAAFEAGRLMAAADPRLAQELMRWRREAYKQSSRADSVAQVQKDLGLAATLDLHVPILPMLTASVLDKVAKGAGPIADAYGLDKIKNVIGLNPDAVQNAFGLASRDEAVAMLGGDAGALGAVVAPVEQTPRGPATIAEAAADTASLDRLNEARARVLANTAAKLGVTNL